jgi:Holliday junction resolvase-like predicted endonuclease
MPPTQKPVVIVELEHQQKKALSDAAWELRSSMSAVIRQALDAFLHDHAQRKRYKQRKDV